MPPTFSVVIPTFNRAHVIRRAIDSVLRQSYTDFELIVVDDGSMDDTASVVGAMTDRRIRLISQVNRGRTAARNAGARAASGRYLAFVDSDDEVLPDWLRDFVAVLERDERLGVVSCGYLHREEGRDPFEVRPARLGPLFGATTERGLFRAQSFAVRTELFHTVGGYDEELGFSENTDLAMRLVPYCIEHGWRIASLDSIGAVYHADRPQNESLETRRLNLASSERMLARHHERLRLVPKVHGRYLSIAGVRAARLSDFPKAREFFTRAIRAYPRDWRNYLRLLLSCVPPIARLAWKRGS